MKISDFNLLEIDVFDGDKLIYNGMSENVPEDLKQRHIKIVKLDGKKLITEITD